VTHNQSIGHLYSQKCYPQHGYYPLKMSLNGASSIFVLQSWIIKLLCNNIKLKSKCWPPLWAIIGLTISLPLLKISINGASTIFGFASRIIQGQCNCVNHNHIIGRLCEEKCYWQYPYHLLRINVSRVSMIFGLASWIIKGLWNGVNSQSTYQLPVWAKC